jgi:hypothetical protein
MVFDETLRHLVAYLWPGWRGGKSGLEPLLSPAASPPCTSTVWSSCITMSTRHIFRRALAALLLLPVVASAQVFQVGREDQEQEFGPRRSPVFGGASLVYGRPTGSFASYVKQGFGADGFVRYKIDRQGAFSLGLEGGFLQYGRETFRVPLSSTVGRINVDVTTSNNILFLGFGPQLMVPTGPVRPYVNGGIGFSYFFTESSVEGSDDDYSFAETTNFSDAVFTKMGGAGIYIPFGSRREAGLDIGARYHGSGRTRYLREGSIEDRPGQAPLIHPVETETKLWSWRIGIVAGMR